MLTYYLSPSSNPLILDHLSLDKYPSFSLMPNADYLQDIIGSAITSLARVRANGVKEEYSFVINCAELEDYNYVDIRQSALHKILFDKLKEMSGPALYIIDVVSATDTRAIVESLRYYKASSRPKATPALKSVVPYDSQTLYVGKVKGAFWGRLIQHLGFFKVNATQGLQLFHWAKDLGLVLRFTVFEFETDMADLMGLVEYAFAKRLHPLIGKHQ